MLKTYLFLVGAIIFEVAGTMLLPITQNFTKLIPTLLLSFFYISAFYLLTFVVNKLPIAIVYASWSGLGIFSITILGYLLFNQSINYKVFIGLILIILGVLLINLNSN
jgi:multidrug transporter EmrE-like cation transporter